VDTRPTAVITTSRPNLVVHRVAPIRAVRSTLRLAQRTAQPAEPAAVRAVELPPLTAVNGIAAGFAARLTEMNIDTVEKLAAARPEDVAAIRGVSRNMASAWIEEAQRLRSLAVRRSRGQDR
jgi:predicted flap endonuclease-1-like 5' DNA nuclease